MPQISKRQEKLGFPKSYGFVIGINKYPEIKKPLVSAVPDAERFYEILKERQGFEHVELFRNLTKSGFENLLQKLIDPNIEPHIQPEDSIVFYYAGHGKPGVFDDGPAGYILPSDAKPGLGTLENNSLIPMESVFETLKTLDCHHTLLILDCCFAGKFRHIGTQTRAIDLSLLPLYEERFEKYKTKKAWQVLVSAGPDQTAADWLGDRQDEEEESAHSPFALALFEALEEGVAEIKPAGKNLGDGVITAHELYLYLWHQVEKRTKDQTTFRAKQHPDLFPMAFHEGGEFIFFHPKHALNFAERTDRNPYMGLKAYQPEDADLYFGRDNQVKAAITKLNKSSILVISAPSGFGKSSFVNAGIYPAMLKKHGLGNVDLMTFTPGKLPASEWKEINEKVNSLRNEEHSDCKTLLMIDQYERVYTECEMDNEKERFESDLKTLLQDVLNPTVFLNTKIIITIRSDFEWQFEASPPSAAFGDKEKALEFFYRLPPMNLDELREAVLKPALVETYDFESDQLVNRILEEVSYAPGALPLMSFGMHELIKITDVFTREISSEKYFQELGGIRGALSKKADEVFELLSGEAMKNAMKKVILRMVSLQDGVYVRRRVPVNFYRVQKANIYHELDYPDDKNDLQVLEVVEKLVSSGLIIQGTDFIGQPYIEPLHDALINFWPQCLQWIQSIGDEELVLQRKLWHTAIRYAHFENEYDLWTEDPRLEGLYKRLEDSDHPHPFNQIEVNFINRSQALRDDELARVKRERDEAMSSALAAKSMLEYQRDHTGALSYAIQAYDQYPTDEAAGALHDILSNPNTQLCQQLVVPRQTILVELNNNNQDTDQPNQIPIQLLDCVLARTDGMIYTVHEDHIIRVWKPDRDVPINQFTPGFPVKILAIGKTGKYLFCANESQASVISLETSGLIANHKFVDYKILRAKFVGSDEELMIEGSGGQVHVWKFLSHAHTPTTLFNERHDRALDFGGAIFGNEWRYIVYYADEYCETWNANADKMGRSQFIYESYIPKATFQDGREITSFSLSPDCRRFVACYNRSYLYCSSTEFDTSGSQISIRFKSFDLEFSAIKFSYDGGYIFGYEEFADVGIWDFESLNFIYRIINFQDIVNGMIDLRSKESWIMLADSQRVKLWSSNPVFKSLDQSFSQSTHSEKTRLTEKEIEVLEKFRWWHGNTIHDQYTGLIKVYSNGNKIVAEKNDFTLECWRDTREEGETFTLDRTLVGHRGKVSDILFDQQGRMISWSNQDGTIRVWNDLTGHLLWTIVVRIEDIADVKFSENGLNLLVYGNDVIEIVRYHLVTD